MKHFRLLSAASALLLAGTAAAAVGTSDPLLTLSYAQGTFLEQVSAQATQTAQKIYDTSLTAADQTLNTFAAANTETTLRAEAARRTASAIYGQAQTLSLSSGSTVSCTEGAEIIVTSGKVTLQSGSLINLTEGKLLSSGKSLTLNHRYLAADGAMVLQCTGAASVQIQGSYSQGTAVTPSVPGGEAGDTRYADALHTLGLFQGGTSGYELTRGATRVEGVVMLIRLLGRDAQAASYTGTHPFTDVPAWANGYVAYAYANGYAKGLTATTFGSTQQLRFLDYMTFLLRALDYSDQNGDFTWSAADQKAVEVGILTEAERQSILNSGFLREEVAYTSFRALFCPTKSGIRLCDRLLVQGVYTQEALTAVEKLSL